MHETETVDHPYLLLAVEGAAQPIREVAWKITGRQIMLATPFPQPNERHDLKLFAFDERYTDPARGRVLRRHLARTVVLPADHRLWYQARPMTGAWARIRERKTYDQPPSKPSER